MLQGPGCIDTPCGQPFFCVGRGGGGVVGGNGVFNNVLNLNTTNNKCDDCLG